MSSEERSLKKKITEVSGPHKTRWESHGGVLKTITNGMMKVPSSSPYKTTVKTYEKRKRRTTTRHSRLDHF